LFVASLFVASLFVASLFVASLFVASLFVASLFVASLFVASLFVASLFVASLFVASLFVASLAKALTCLVESVESLNLPGRRGSGGQMAATAHCITQNTIVCCVTGKSIDLPGRKCRKPKPAWQTRLRRADGCYCSLHHTKHHRLLRHWQKH